MFSKQADGETNVAIGTGYMQTFVLNFTVLSEGIVELDGREEVSKGTTLVAFGLAIHAKHLHGSCIGVDDVKVGVNQDDPFGRIADNVNGKAFGTFAHVWQAYIDIGIAVDNSPSFFTTGVVTAGTAV